jgi:hypothetical protein
VTLQRLWAVLAVALPALAALIASMSTIDLAYQLRAGAEILDGHGIPRVDTWTFTVSGQPWHDQQWGAQVLLALTERLAGWTGLALLRAALTGATIGLVALAAIRQGASARTASLLALAAFAVAAVAMALRPQLFAMALFALVLLLVVERRRRPWLLWLAVPVTLLWANLHGSFFLGLALLAYAWVDDAAAGRGHRGLAVLTASLAVTLANPWGPEIWSYALGLTTDTEVRRRITEWQPTGITEVPGILFYGSGALVALLVARRRPSWPTAALLVALFVLGVIAARGAAWWPLVAAVVAAGLLRDAGAEATRTRRERPLEGRLNAVVVALLIVVGVVALPAWRPTDPGTRAPAGLLTAAPSGLTSRLRELATPQDRLFAPQEWGSWFEYAIPATPVYLDSRVELFPDEVWRDHDAIRSREPGGQVPLRQWGVTLVAVAPGDLAFADRLAGDGWQRVYDGDDGWLLTMPPG